LKSRRKSAKKFDDSRNKYNMRKRIHEMKNPVLTVLVISKETAKLFLMGNFKKINGNICLRKRPFVS
jgi:hypothetical protein